VVRAEASALSKGRPFSGTTGHSKAMGVLSPLAPWNSSQEAQRTAAAPKEARSGAGRMVSETGTKARPASWRAARHSRIMFSLLT
jgi:hypothetical protein